MDLCSQVTWFKCDHLFTGLKQLCVQWEPTESEKEILIQNPKRRRVETTSTIGSYIIQS